MPARRREGLLLELLVVREARIEHATHVELVEHLCGAADVVGLRVRQHQHIEPPHSERAQPPRHVRIAGPGIDERREARSLDQGRVPLPHVQERDAERRRRRAARRRRPEQRDDAERGKADGDCDERDLRPPPAPSRSDPERQPEESEDGAADRGVEPGPEARDDHEVVTEHARGERERRRSDRRQRMHERRGDADEQERCDGRQRDEVRGQAPDERHPVELRPGDRRGGERAGARDRERFAQSRGTRGALEPERAGAVPA